MKVEILIAENLYEMVREEYGDHKSDEFRTVLFPPVRECSGCTLCCKLLGVPELEKPREIWCKTMSSRSWL